MDYISGFTFGWYCERGDLKKEKVKDSLNLLKQRTNSSYIILALAARQETANSTIIDYKNKHMVEDQELIDFIQFAKQLGFKVILKPTIDVADGTWRAHINFFDRDVPCEPKWSEWFQSYQDYQIHYAKIAEETECEMLIVGCEMVQSERRELEWRQTIRKIRDCYGGLISYNTDKYQEENVNWWDEVDVISSSGYYPINQWERELNRIESVVAKYNKPFFFAEAGCMSRTGSSFLPNKWDIDGQVNLQEQRDYYDAMFQAVNKRPWVQGFGLWDWSGELYKENASTFDRSYNVFGKPAEKVVNEFYKKKNGEMS